MLFRLFEPKDIDLYLRWINQKAIWEVDGIGPYQFQTVGTFKNQWERIVDWRRSWFFSIDGKDIGYVGFVSDENDDLTNEFFIVIGDMDEWGKGRGSIAMEWLFDKARECQLRELVGHVHGNNERALKFYKNLGFETVSEEPNVFVRNGQHYSQFLIRKKL